MPDNVDKLFEIMQANGAANDRNKFRKVFLTPGNKGYKIRKDIYDGLRADGIIDSPTYEDFRRKLRLGGTPTVNKYRQQMFNSVDPNKNGLNALSYRAVSQAKRAMNNVRKPVVAKVVNREGKPTGKEFAITPAKTVEDLDREYAQETTKNWENELHDQMADADKDAAKISDMFKSFIGSTDEVGSVWGNMTRGGGIAGTPHSVTTNNGILENTEARQILAAGDYNRKRKELLRLEKDSRNGAIFDNHSFFRGMYDAAKDTGFLTGGASDIINAGSLLATKQDLDNGVHTEAGDMLMQQAVKNSNAQSQYGDNQGWMYTGGVITTNMAPFIVQIASAGFSKGLSTSIGKVVQGAASKVALGTMKKAAGFASADLAKNIGKVTGLTTKAFGKAIQYGIVGAAQANTVGLGKVANDVINRYTGQVYQDEQGNYKFGTFDSDGKLVHEGGEDFLTALVKGEAAQTIEFATELAGGGIDAVGTALKNFVTKGGKKIINKYNMENVSKVIDFLLNNKVSKNVRYLKAGADRTLGKVEVNSIFGESLEEELGIIANTVFTGDNKISDLWDEKQQSQIWGGMLLSIGLMKGVVAPFHAYNAKQYYSYKHKLNKADVNLSQLLGKEKWEELRNQIDATTNEDMPEMVNKINRDVALGKNRQPVREYIQNLLIMRGFDIGNMLAAKKAVEDKGEGVSVKNMEKNQAYQQGRDAYGYDTHEIQLDQEDKQKSLAQLLGISEQQLASMSDEELESFSGRDDNIDRAIYDYQLSSARYEGVVDNARDQIDLEVQRAAQAVDMYTDKSRNTIRNATIKASGGLEDYGVYIISGNIATHDDGSIDVSNSDDMILYYDPTTNTVEHADAMMFAELGSEENADEVRSQAMADAKEKAIKETTGIIDGVVEVGTQFKTVDADGTEHTYEVLADNGDGTAMITIDGNVPTELVKGENVQIPYSFEDLQKMKDEADQQRLQAAKAQREQMDKERAEQQMQSQTTQAENPAHEDNIQSAPIEDNIDYSDIIREDGKVQMVDVSDKYGNDLFPDAKDVFYIQGNKMRTKFAYIDVNGELKTQSFPTGLVKIKTRGEVSVDDYKKYRNTILAAESSFIPESSKIEDNSGENRGEIEEEAPTIEGETAEPAEETTTSESGEDSATEQNPAAEQTPAITLEDGTIVPMLEDGNPDFSKLSAAQTAELYDTQFDEDADGIVSGYVSDAKKALDKANNMTVKGKTFVEQKAAKAAKEKAIADAQAAYDSAVAIRDAYNERQLAKEENTPEGRKSLIEKARRKYARLKNSEEWSERPGDLWNETVGKLLHRLYDATGIDVFNDTPNTVYEYVAANVGPYSLNYEGNDNSKGVQQETGLSRSDFAKLGWLAAEGKGMTIDAKVHRLWENRPSNLESADTQDIRNALISLITSGQTAFQARDYILNQRIELAESALEEQLRQEEDVAEAQRVKEEEEKKKAELEKKAEEEKKKADENINEKTKFPDKLKDGSETIEVPEDATDENPLGLQLSEDKVPFEIEGGKSGETYNINDDEDRQRLINDNKVDDKDILVIDMPKHVHKAIKELCKKMGLKVQFLYMGARSNGWIENGTMYLALDTEKATQFVFGHEMTHAIKQKNPEAYKELVKVAMAVTTRKKFEEDLAKVYQNYHGISGYNNVDDYVEEVVADNLGKFINDFDLAQKFSLRLNHPVLATILHAIQKIKSLLYGDFYKSVDALERIVEKAYVKTAKGQVVNSETGEDVSFSLRLKAAIEETETNPSDAQKESGNYKKGHIKFGGYDYTIENPKGSTRSGKDADGKEWKITMHDTYGYIRGKFGKDGDHLDMFINDKADLDNWNGDVFVVDQVNPDGSFDEHKVMYGYDSMDDAEKAYLANYSKGWKGLGSITGVSKDEFDKWLDTSKRKLKPFADYAKVKFSQAQSVSEPRYSLKDIKPVGVGAFGNIYNQFRGNAKAAIEFLKKVRGGEAVGALHHKDIGDIDLVWGKEGTGHSDGYGLSKLVKYHPEVLDNLQEILNDMRVVSSSKNRVNLESETHKAGVRLTWDGERKSWLLTAFKKETSASDKRTDTAATSLEGDTALSQTEGSAAKIDNSSETAKENGEKFSLKEEKTLAGVHNITEEKLLKAIKQGGLANPSVAVIDSSKQNYENYGDISLILPSDKVAKRTGKNAGTWQGDAWTPTYPQVERQMSNKGAAKASKDVSSVPGDMYREVRRGLDRWLDGGEANSAMAYMFLHEKGVAPEPKKIQHKFSDDVYNELKSITAGDFNIYGIGKADAQKVLDMYIDAKFGGDKDLYEEKTKAWLERNKSIVDAGNKGGMRYTIAKENVELYDEYGFNYKSVQTFVHDVEYDHRKTGVDMNAMLNEVEDYIKTNNLTDEFNTWLEGKEKEYGIKEVIFDGFTPSGNRRYVPNTLENVSKIMKKQGRNGATGISVSFQNFAASLMPSYGTLKDIRSKKGLLTSDHEDLDKFNEKWSNVFFELGMKCQPDATGTFDDYGLARLSEAAKTSDPQAYLMKEYNVDFSDEDTKRLKEMVKAIKEESPAMYFETKFERPVGFNEFSSAVVPTTASDEVKQALQNAGVQIYEYDKNKEGDRSRAFNEAINSSDNIRFSLKAMMEKPEGWKQANKKAIHIAEAIERDPKFSLKNLDGTLIKAGTYFSGGGLVEEGLKGIIDPVVAVEYDEKISGVYRNNFGQHIVTADVRDVDPKELVKHIDGEVEYFHASPVCKNYSQAKSNHAELELDKETAASTAEFINAIKPKVVTVENVKGYKDSEAMKIITDALDANGYTWDADVYNAADYGGYTNRERLIVRAVRDGKLPDKPKKMAHKSGWYEAVADIIPTLTEKKNGVAPWMDIRLKADGIDWRNIDKPLYVMGSAYADGKIPHAFANELLPTLRTKSGDVIVMPDGKVYRAMGRVLARVSGVSDDYKMPFSENLSHTIIGNGIPTQLTDHVIAPLLTGSDPKFSIRTYHGTGASFDKFDFSHMGEGEGSQAFGWGGYVTNSKDIAEDYTRRAKIRKDNGGFEFVTDMSANNKDMVRQYIYKHKDVNKGLDAMRKDLSSAIEMFPDDDDLKELSNILVKKNDEIAVPDNIAYLYDVDIPDDNGDYLDWENKLKKSHLNKVNKELVRIGKEPIETIYPSRVDGKVRGQDLYDELSSMLGSKEAASKLLSDAGFVGIKYPAGTIFGGAKEDDYNYVIFDENNANIVGNTRFSLRPTTPEDGNTKYSLKQTNDKFNSDLKSYVEDGVIPENSRFELGFPSDTLLSAGFPKLPISMRVSLLNKKAGMERHPFSPTDLYNLVDAIQEPLAIFEYTKPNMRNLIVDLTKGEKHFLVGVTLDYRKGDLAVNSISGLFPKENHEWIKWIQDGKAIRIDKKDKVLSLIDSLRTNPEEAERIGLNLDFAAKIIKYFENPSVSSENSLSDTKFSLRGSTPYDKQMEEWKEKNHLEKDATPMKKPVMKEGENIFDYANRMVEWTRNQNLWKTAPKQTGFQEALDKWKADNGIAPGAYPPVHPIYEDFQDSDDYNQAVAEYRKEKEVWKTAPKPKDFDLSVDLDDMNKQLRNIRRAVLNQKNYDQRTVKAVSDLVRKMLNIGWGDGLSRGKVGNLLSAAKNATGANDVKKYLDKVIGILAENYLNRLSTAYDNLINTKGARADQSGVIKMGSLDAKGQAFMSEYKKAINMDDSSLNTYIANIEEDSAKNEDNVEMNDYRLAGIQAAIMYKQQIGGNDADIAELKRQIGELKNKKDATKEDKDLQKSLEKKLFENKFDRITMYENLLNNIQRMVKESKGRAKEFREKIVEHKNEILHRANLDLEGMDSAYYDTTTAKKKFVNNPILRFVMSSTYTFEQFLKFFGRHHANGEGYLYNYFMSEWQDTADEQQLYNEMNRNALDEKTKELFGKKNFTKLVGIDGKGMKEMDIDVTDYSNKKTGKRTIHLKQGQMLYIYLVNKETDGEMKLRAMGITEEKVAEIEKNLDPRVKSMGEWLQNEYLPECQRRYQATHTKYFGAPMKEVENYFPLAINNRARNVREDLNQDTDAISRLAGTSTGAIITRRVNVIPLDIENADAFAVAFNHLDEMEEWSAYLPFIQDVNTLLSSTHFRNQVMNMSSAAYGSGKTLWEEFKKVAQIAAGTYKPKVDNGMMDSKIAAVVGGIATAKISGRLWTAFKQTQSATTFLTECDPARFLWYGVNPYGSWHWAYDNLPLFRKRVEQLTAGDVKVKQFLDELEKYHDWTKTIAKVGMSPNILVDSVTCAVGARSVYETELNKLTKLGYPKDKAEEKAIQKASLSYNKTQQSSEGAFLSPMQVDRTYVSAALSLYKNANYAYGRKKIEAIRGIAKTYRFWGEHKNAMIGSMTRQIMDEDGLDENVANAIAKRAYTRTFWYNIGTLLNYMTIVPISWASYKVLLYLLNGDDDDKKKKMIEEACLKGFATTTFDDYVIPFASNILNAGLNIEDGKIGFDTDVFKYQNLYINPATSDLSNIYSMIGNQKWWSAGNKFGMLGIQMLVGFNPETIGALYQAYDEFDNDSGNMPLEIKLAVLKSISAPEESIRGLYMDELGLDNEDRTKVPLSVLEQRYAERQINRDNLLSQVAMPKETFDGYVEKYKKSFEKKIQDKMDKMDAYDQRKFDAIFDTTTDQTLKGMMEKKRTKDANAAADEQIAKEGLNQEKKGKEPSEEAYEAVKMSIDVAEDNAISTYNKVLNKRYAALNDEYNEQTDAMKYIFMSKHPNFKAYKDLESKYTTYGKKMKELKEKLVSADGYDAKQTILKQIRAEREKFSELQSKVR